MVDDPDVDGRRRDALLDRAETIAPYYTDEWDPDGDDAGAVLMALFADMAEDVVERLDQFPEKHRVSFLDTLGFERDPPQPAELPLVAEIADDAGQNVRLPEGTRATAEGEETEQVFRLQDGFEATPANVARVFSVDPANDEIFAHGRALDDGSTRLFRPANPAEENLQRHALYVGHTERLDLGPEATIDVVVETDAPAAVRDELVWEYFGEKEVDGEAVTDWHEFPEGADASVLRDGTYDSFEEAYGVLQGLLSERGFKARTANPYMFSYYLMLTLLGDAPTQNEDEDLWTKVSNVMSDEATTDYEPSFEWSDFHDDPDRLAIVAELYGLYQGLLDGVSDRLDEFDADPEVVKRILLCRIIMSLNGWIAFSDAFDPPESLAEAAEGPYADAVAVVHTVVARLAAKAGVLGPAPGDDGPARLTLVTDGSIDEHTVDGVQSRWIRCRVPRDYDGPDPFEITIGGGSDGEDVADHDGRNGDGSQEGGPEYRPPIRIGSRGRRLQPDGMFANDVPMKVGEGGIRPFGDWPRMQDAFYLASADVFTKPGTEVTLTFIDPLLQSTIPFGRPGTGWSEDDDPPSLSWEYFDGDGWSQIEGLTEHTDHLRKHGHVSFSVPPDLEATEVSGQENHWIRVRLVGGDYGELSVEKTNENPEKWTTKREFDEPSFTSVFLDYDEQRDPSHLVAENNLEYGPDLVAAEEEQFEPFEGLPDEVQTLYLGFDAPLHDGPITTLFEMEDVEYPPEFHPDVRWEHRPDPGRQEWVRPDVRDGTEGLTEQGIVKLGFSAPTSATSRFGERLHWIRARVSRDQFGPLSDPPDPPPREETPEGAPEACGETVRTKPPSGLPRRHRPELDAIHPNAGWARNVRTVTDEVLGSSDASQDQTFTAESQPVVDPTVWVDELDALGPDRRKALLEADPDRVEAVTDVDDELTAFWVRWSREPDLLDAGPDDRHYTLDPVAGRITFGDGNRGKIPPAGTENVRATYTTGGGADGNVERGAVGGLRRSLAFVDEVTNPLAADGGADAESTAAVGERAPRTLRDRGRAVAATDYERIAMDATRRLARVRCLPGMDRYGRYRPGWVTLLIVPDTSGEKPTPSVSLKRQVETAVADRAPVSLVELEATDQLVVRGPSYVPVSVDVELVSDGTRTVSTLEEAAREAVAAFLDPLTGSPDGDGWAFGEVPCPSDCYALLEAVDGVDHVVDLVLRFEGEDGVHEVREGEPTPSVADDVLVYSGTHEVVAHLDHPGLTEGS